VSKADDWKFRGAVYGAMQGHAKPLADLLELLRTGHARTAEDEQLLVDLIRQLRTREKGAPGRKETPRAFTHTADVRAAVELATQLQDRCAARGIKLTKEAAATVVAGTAVAWRNSRHQVAVDRLAEQTSVFVRQVLTEWRRPKKRV